MKRIEKKQIEGNVSELERKALFLINQYGPEIRHKQYWESGKMMASGIKTYVPYGGNHYRPKPHFVTDDNWEYDSPEFLLMKIFLNKYLEYDTRNARSVRKWYGL